MAVIFEWEILQVLYMEVDFHISFHNGGHLDSGQFVSAGLHSDMDNHVSLAVGVSSSTFALV